MKSNTAIELREVSLSYPKERNLSPSIKNIFSLKRKSNRDQQASLSNLSLTIEKGEIVGVLGHNGAGKSTLLRLLSRIYLPDKGTVLLNGNVTLLAALGTGFQRDLSGRDNILLSGALHGIELEKIKALIPSIILFSGLEKVIDKPLRTYSSGMRARLGFSVIAHLDAEILLFDEVFAVGDSSFRSRSKKRILEMVEGDTTVVIVTHNEQLIRELCTRVICLNDGELMVDTKDTEEGIRQYHQSSNQKDES
jgi:ABC-type polysaccharide/polyol phosphate transport system ATPase subunit